MRSVGFIPTAPCYSFAIIFSLKSIVLTPNSYFLCKISSETQLCSSEPLRLFWPPTRSLLSTVGSVAFSTKANKSQARIFKPGCQNYKKQVQPWRFYHGGFNDLSITIKKAQRINELPPYLFAEIDRRKRAALARGVDLIDLGVGDPYIPTPAAVVEKLVESASKPNNHRYPNSSGMLEFREAVSDWYHRRFGVKLDPDKEVVSLIGSKEGIANMAVGFVDPGDIVLVASPCYPVYHIGTDRKSVV